MPLWAWLLLIVYLSLLFLATLWTIIERTRSAMLKRARKLPDPEPPLQAVTHHSRELRTRPHAGLLVAVLERINEYTDQPA